MPQHRPFSMNMERCWYTLDLKCTQPPVHSPYQGRSRSSCTPL